MGDETEREEYDSIKKDKRMRLKKDTNCFYSVVEET